MIVLKEFEFDAAHYLPEYNGKCERLHGHTYKLVVKVQGTPDHEGMVIDFIRLKNIVKENVLVHLDHACINAALGRKHQHMGMEQTERFAARR